MIVKYVMIIKIFDSFKIFFKDVKKVILQIITSLSIMNIIIFANKSFNKRVI